MITRSKIKRAVATTVTPKHWKFDTYALIEGFKDVSTVCALKDGRLCGACEDFIIVWNTDSHTMVMTMKGHTRQINQVIQLTDGRICSCSDDASIKLWNVETGECEVTLAGPTGHRDLVICMLQLFDGRLCSCSRDHSIIIWNLSSCVYEMAMTPYIVRSLAQLADGHICVGDVAGLIHIGDLLSGNSKLQWMAHPQTWVTTIVCIDRSKICTGILDIKIWNASTGECERTLTGHTNTVTSMVLVQDGRLCSASYDKTLKLWNLETGECENTLNTEKPCFQVLQLEDGRLLCNEGYDGEVRIWS